MRRETVGLPIACALMVVACGSTAPSAAPAVSASAAALTSASPSVASVATRPPSAPPYQGVPVETIAATPDGRKRNVLLIIADDFGLDLSPRSNEQAIGAVCIENVSVAVLH